MTLQEWRQTTENLLTQAGFENASQEAKWLLAGALDQESSFVTFSPTYLPSPAEDKKIKAWLKRRLQGEPLSRLKGTREFWSLPFHLNEHTLDPRPETEILVEGVLKWVSRHRRDDPWRILDLGTGSGCLLISLLHELKNARGTGVDISEGALLIAEENAHLNTVGTRATFLQTHWGGGLTGPYDIIVSNPPYIPLAEKDLLEKGVRNYDPPQALFGGEDGLDCYRLLAPEIKRLLSPFGIAVLEMGIDQRHDIERIFHHAGLKTLFILPDLAGIERTLGVEHT